MRPMQVVARGTSVPSMIEGVSEEEFRQMNEFPLTELSRSWAAFGTAPLLKQVFPPVQENYLLSTGRV